MSDLSKPVFSVVRLREGYDMAEVDMFLAEVQRELAGRLPNQTLADRIRTERFSPVRLKRGYDMGEVDQHLDSLIVIASGGPVTS